MFGIVVSTQAAAAAVVSCICIDDMVFMCMLFMCWLLMCFVMPLSRYDYYQHWERKIFAALTHMIALGMRDFQSVLTGFHPNATRPANDLLFGDAAHPLPLIKVVAEMNAPAILVTPNIQDIYKTLSKLLRNIPESAKNFVRWMDGQCKVRSNAEHSMM